MSKQTTAKTAEVSRVDSQTPYYDGKVCPKSEIVDDNFTIWTCHNCTTEGLEEWFSFCPCCGKELIWQES